MPTLGSRAFAAPDRAGALDPEVLRATRIRAARTGRRDSDVLGLAVVDRIRSRFDLDEEEAIRLANEELRAMRRDRGKGRAR